MRPGRVVLAAATALAALAGCGGSGQGPLHQEESAASVSYTLNPDATRRADMDLTLDLANPTDHPIRIVSFESIPDPRSPAPVEIVSFQRAGPHREEFASGPPLSDREIGDVLPAGEAVIPPHSGKYDYAAIVRYVLPPGTRWARNGGVRMTYETDGATYTTDCRSYVLLCSHKAMGERFCDDLR